MAAVKFLVSMVAVVLIGAVFVAYSELLPSAAPDRTPSVEYTMSPDGGRQRYVSTSGSDDGDGSFDRPWRTLPHAITLLEPGDVLNLRGGIHYLSELEVSLAGEPMRPVTIRSFPGETAVIDGGIEDFRLGSDSWVSVDDDIDLYRSRAQYDQSRVRAWLTDLDYQLIEYDEPENLSSQYYGPARGTDALYLGPGVHLADDGFIYIRLAANPLDLTNGNGEPVPAPIAETDPNDHDISVFFSDHIFELNAATYLQFVDLTFRASERIFDAEAGSRFIAVLDSTWKFGSYGVVVRDGVRDWLFRGNDFLNGLPDTVYWTDVKNLDGEDAEAYPEFQSTAIQGPLVNFEVSDNRFLKSFDGVQLDEGSLNTLITNNLFGDLRDDAVNINRASSNVEVSHNVMWRVGAGLANLGSSKAPGPVFIHHNIIDNSGFQRGGREGNVDAENWPVWMVIDPFARHDSEDRRSWWKIYNNTIVTRRGGYDWNAAGPTPVEDSPELHVVNNIFYALDNRVLFRGARFDGGSRFDGNVVFHDEGRLPMFLEFGDGGSYSSLDEFRRETGGIWEAAGLQVDPGFASCLLFHDGFSAGSGNESSPGFRVDESTSIEAVRHRYQPANPEVLTPGASYDDGWPGVPDPAYRGAVATALSTESAICP